MKGILLVSSLVVILLLTPGLSPAFAPPLHSGNATITTSLQGKFSRHTALGNRFYEDRDYERAISEYNLALRFHKEILDRCNNRRRSCKDRASHRERAISTHLLIGRSLSALGDYYGARTYFDIVIDLDTDDPRGYYERSRVLVLLGEGSSATSDYNMLIELDPEETSNYVKRAYIFLHGGERNHGGSDYRLLIEVDPEGGNAYNDRSEGYFKHFGSARRACNDWRVSCELGECSNLDRANREGICD